MELIDLYDNVLHGGDPDLKSSWGFSCLVRGASKTVLFDVGERSDILLHNFARLGIDPNCVDVVALSHSDADHSGALFGFLEARPKAEVYLVNDYPEEFHRRAASYGARVHIVRNFEEILPNVFLTGIIPAEGETSVSTMKKEQALILARPEGSVILTGCAHMGLLPLARENKKRLNTGILLLAGGLHFFETAEETVRAMFVELKDFGLLNMAPAHCSGKSAAGVYEGVFDRKAIAFGLGSLLRIEKSGRVIAVP